MLRVRMHCPCKPPALQRNTIIRHALTQCVSWCNLLQAMQRPMYPMYHQNSDLYIVDMMMMLMTVLMTQTAFPG